MRNKRVDIARGALIFYIVAIIHGVFWLQLIPRPYSSVLLFEMPLIFMVSGFAYALFEANSRFVLTRQSYARFVLSRGVRILLPYLVYALCCTIFVLWWRGSVSAVAIVDTALAWLNPVVYGRDHSLAMLNWHLWFILPFLIITLLFPLFIRFYPPRVPLWLTAIGATIFVTLVAYLLPTADLLITAVFYLFWFYAGYKQTDKQERRHLLLTVLVGILVIGLSSLFSPVTLDMQINKFPPNYLFFSFSAVWVGLFLLLFSMIDLQKFEFLATAVWFKPFIAAGYSIYLWQGIGYTVAHIIGSRMDLSVYLIWLVAMGLTVLLGVLFSPLEKIRVRRRVALQK